MTTNHFATLIMRSSFLTIFLLFIIIHASAVPNQGKSKIDSIFKTNHDLEGYIMPLYQHSNDANKFQFNYFRLRSRGKISRQLSYFIQLELVDKPTIKDASVDIKLSDFFIIRAGQFQYHFGVFEKPWNFPTIFLPQIKRYMLGDPRDMGIQFNGSVKNLNYYAAVVNGTGRGVSEDDKKKL